MTVLHVDPKNSNLHILNDAPANRTNLVIHNNDDRSVLKLRRNSLDNDPNDITSYGGIYFERHDVQGVWTESMILGGEDYILLATTNNGIIDDDKSTLTFRNGKLGIGTTVPKHELDVKGTIHGTLCLPVLSEEDLKNTVPQNGMIVVSEDHGLIIYINEKWKNISIGEEI